MRHHRAEVRDPEGHGYIITHAAGRGPCKTRRVTGILMGAETQDSHGKPFVFVVLDVSVYDPAMSDSLIPVGRLIQAGFMVIHPISS